MKHRFVFFVATGTSRRYGREPTIKLLKHQESIMNSFPHKEFNLVRDLKLPQNIP
ncbi:hypothetical protein PIB30_066410, partial [Stylosanthes scabra]|nr:hypothetical protein [Stylosanthes scabra]